MIRGMKQVLAYLSSAARLNYTVTDDTGITAKPDADPKITIYNTSSEELVAETSMTVEVVGKEAYLAYKNQTAEFEVGRELTGGTSGAKAVILTDRKSGATGVLFLGDIDGTFQDGETITDNGTGSAVADGTLYSCSYYYDVDISAKSNWPLGQNYQAKVTYQISGKSYTRWIYFDVAYYPMTAPIVTSQDIDREQPTWVQIKPDGWADWSPAIQSVHADLVRRIHSLGEQAARYVAREEEFWQIELSAVKARIAEACGMTREDIAYWRAQADKVWAARGLVTYDDNDDSGIDDTRPRVLQSRFTR